MPLSLTEVLHGVWPRGPHFPFGRLPKSRNEHVQEFRGDFARRTPVNPQNTECLPPQTKVQQVPVPRQSRRKGKATPQTASATHEVAGRGHHGAGGTASSSAYQRERQASRAPVGGTPLFSSGRGAILNGWVSPTEGLRSLSTSR